MSCPVRYSLLYFYECLLSVSPALLNTLYSSECHCSFCVKFLYPVFEFSGVFAALHDISVKSAVIKFSMQRHRSSQTCCSGMNCLNLCKYENVSCEYTCLHCQFSLRKCSGFAHNCKPKSFAVISHIY